MAVLNGLYSGVLDILGRIEIWFACHKGDQFDALAPHFAYSGEGGHRE
jgi:hypothetical protein